MCLRACVPACLRACVPACLLICSTVSFAGTVSSASLEVAGWTYHPIFDQGEASSLIAIRTPDNESQGVLALRCTPIGGTDWSYESWDTASYEEIVLYIAESNGIARQDAADAYQDVPLDMVMFLDPIVVGVAPSPFAAGLKSVDPLQPAVQASSDPHAVLGALESFGYPAVSTLSIGSTTGSQEPIDPVILPEDCVQISAGGWLTVVKDAFDFAQANPSATPEEVIEKLAVLQACCQPFVLNLSGNEGPWTCGNFTLDFVVLQIASHTCVYQYSRTANQSQGRVRIQQDANCIVKWCMQFRARSGTQYEFCGTPPQPTLPPGGTCEGTNCPPPTVGCNPNPLTFTGYGPWTPAVCP